MRQVGGQLDAEWSTICTAPTEHDASYEACLDEIIAIPRYAVSSAAYHAVISGLDDEDRAKLWTNVTDWAGQLLARSAISVHVGDIHKRFARLKREYDHAKAAPGAMPHHIDATALTEAVRLRMRGAMLKLERSCMIQAAGRLENNLADSDWQGNATSRISPGRARMYQVGDP